MAADVDNAVLALLRAVPNLRVHDGDVTGADWDEKVIAAPLPYAIFFTTPGAPVTPRLSGRNARTQTFTINSVGSTREQAVFIGDRTEAALQGVRILNGRRIGRTDDQPFVRRDDEWTRPGGAPLFTDSRRYSILAH